MCSTALAKPPLMADSNSTGIFHGLKSVPFFHCSMKKIPLDAPNCQHLRRFLSFQNGHHTIKKKKGDPAEVTVISSTLVLPNITMEDKGIYSCKAEISPTRHKNASAKVLVYGERLTSERKNMSSFFFGAFSSAGCVFECLLLKT